MRILLVICARGKLPDVLAREGVHLEMARVPYTPGWDLVGIVDQLGDGVSSFELRQTVAAMPIHGCYAQYLCVPRRPVPTGLDAAEAVVRSVELHHGVSDAASISEGTARTASC